MKIRFSSHRRFFAVAVALLLTSFSALRADTVSFSSTGSFDGAGNSITFGSGANQLTISFTGLSDTVDDDPFSYISLGSFQTSVIGNGASITSGTTFSLDITQFAPVAGSGSLLGMVSGTISQNKSTGAVIFSISSVLIGGETYSLINNIVPLVSPSNTGLTTIQATVAPAAVPEPASTALIALALFGLAGWKFLGRQANRA